MAQRKEIAGKITYQNIGMGFWGITDDTGRQWMLLHTPEQLKIDGARVECTVQIVEDVVTSAMWGTPVHLISFETPMP